MRPAFTARDGMVFDLCGEDFTLDQARYRASIIADLAGEPTPYQPAMRRRLIEITAAIREAEAQQSNMNREAA